MCEVEWRPVVGFEGVYEVSELGQVRRCKPMAGARTSDGYLMVQLSDDSRKSYRKMHALVMESFVGPKPPGLEINHIDGDKANNALSNLEYVTRSENVKHAYRLGLNPGSPKGSKNHNAKLTEDGVRQIRRRLEPDRVMASELGVSVSAVHLARRGKTWKHVDTPPDVDRPVRALDMLTAGLSVAEVATAFGVHVTTVSSWRRAYGGDREHLEPKYGEQIPAHALPDERPKFER